jgi:hypothetical protein
MDMVKETVSYAFGVLQGCAQKHNVYLSKWNYMTWTDNQNEVHYLRFGNISTLMISYQLSKLLGVLSFGPSFQQGQGPSLHHQSVQVGCGAQPTWYP